LTNPTKRIGIVGLPGAWSTEALADRVEAETGFRLVVEMTRVHANLHAGRVMFDGHDLCQLDALIIKKLGASYNTDMLDRLEVLRFVESRGVRCFSSPRSVLGLLDRLSCTVTLSAAGIPMPPTVVTEDVQHAIDAIKQFGKAVCKPLYSTKARGMTVLASDDPKLAEKVHEFKTAGNQVIYLQRMLELPGKDLGVMFLGGEYQGTYARVKRAESWNSTIASGGKYAPHEPSEEIIELARRAQALFDLTFTSVDVVETSDGPMVFEVSAFGGFSGLRDGCQIDAPTLYARHVLKELQNQP